MQMRKAMQDKPRLLERANRTFSCLEEAVASREPVMACLRLLPVYIVERNLRACRRRNDLDN